MTDVEASLDQVHDNVCDYISIAAPMNLSKYGLSEFGLLGQGC